MKVKVSISMEKETVQNVEKLLPLGLFRNKSHFVEVATKKYLMEVSNGSN